MKATEFIDIYEMLDRIVNNGDNVKDFGIIDENGEIYAALESGEIYSFFIEKGKEQK